MALNPLSALPRRHFLRSFAMLPMLAQSATPRRRRARRGVVIQAVPNRRRTAMIRAA